VVENHSRILFTTNAGSSSLHLLRALCRHNGDVRKKYLDAIEKLSWSEVV